MDRTPIKNTWDATPERVLTGKIVVDCGAGSGAQALWALQSGARHVIALELSHAVDGVISKNLESSGFQNYDIVQCSIDAPPLRARSIPGIVICHNVIQHTPSVERTANALFATVAPGGEFVFNAYSKNDETPMRWLRDHLIYRPLREVLRRAPFLVRLGYSHSMGALRLTPGVGWFLEKSGVCVCGDVPSSGSQLEDMRRRYGITVLNTFDYFGGHAYQHHPSDEEIRMLVRELQPDTSKVLNLDRYFDRPRAPGCALRVLA